MALKPVVSGRGGGELAGSATTSAPGRGGCIVVVAGVQQVLHQRAVPAKT